MGCGSSSGLGLRPRSRRTAASSGDGKERKLSVRGPVPFINVTFGSNVDKSPPKVIFVFGELIFFIRKYVQAIYVQVDLDLIKAMWWDHCSLCLE